MYTIDFSAEEAAERHQSHFGSALGYQRDHSGEAVYAGEVEVPLINFIYRTAKELLQTVENESRFFEVYQDFTDIVTRSQVRK